MKKTLFRPFFLRQTIDKCKKKCYNNRVYVGGVPLDKREQKKIARQERKKQASLVTKESFGATCALFSFLALLILFSRSLIFGIVGEAIHSFLTGMFGYFAYPLFFGVLYLSITALIGKRFVKNRLLGVCIALTMICIALIAHTIATYSWDLQGYIAKSFRAGENFPKATLTGWTGSLFVYAISKATTKVGAIIFFSILTLFFGYMAFLQAKRVPKTQSVAQEQEKNIPSTGNGFEIPLSTVPSQAKAVDSVAISATPEQSVAQGGYTPTFTQRPGVRLQDEPLQESSMQENGSTSGAFSPFGTSNQGGQAPTRGFTSEEARGVLFSATPAENYRNNLIFDPNASVNKRPAYNPNQSAYTPSYTEAYQQELNDRTSAPLRPTKIVNDATNGYSSYNTERAEVLRPLEEAQPIVQEPIPVVETPMIETPMIETPIIETQKREDAYTLNVEETPSRETSTEYRRHEYMDLFSPSNPNVFGRQETEEDPIGGGRGTPMFEEEPTVRGFSDRMEDPSLDEEPTFRSRDRGLNIFDEPETSQDNPYSLPETENDPLDLGDRTSRSLDRGRETYSAPVAPMQPVVEPPKPTPPKPRVIRPYVRLSLDDLDCRDVEPTANHEEVEQTKADIIATLEDFNVTGATIASVTFGPAVTRYNVALPRNIPPKKVVALDQSIAISLHSAGVNVYPNFEDGVVSIEVPNKERQSVSLGSMLAGDSYVNAKKDSLVFAMGKDVANRKVYGDISKMIHMLVAGSSGSGKSVFLGSLIISLIYKYSPEELRLILIDPKKTEFVLYNDLPHLMINEIITDVNKAVQSLNWAIGEMNRRYTLFEQMSRSGKYVVKLDEYNENVEKAERLPKIVIIIDELADLMLAAKKEIEDRIQNLTQKARAAGIHLIVATQRPSTDVITGVIKSNLATRIAFTVASDVDSRVILDQTGAQKLLGKGDCMYTMPGVNTPVRIQSAFISTAESQKVVNFIKEHNEAYFDEEATAFINNTRSAVEDPASGDRGGVIDPMYIEALRYVILSGSASISMIQRKCSAGYNRAGKIIEWMEDMGYISAFDGAKARKVLISKEEFESKYGPL